MKRSRSIQVAVAIALALSMTSCDPDSLKDIIEDKFEDFTGLETALKRPYIVGLTPAPDFPNIHCCWVGDRTKWDKIAGSWSTEKKTEVNAGITGIIKAIGVSIDADSTSYVEAKAEPFYRQQLVNIRHFKRDHCPAHDSKCSKDLCTDSLKAGKISVSAYTEWKGGLGIDGKEIGKVKIGNKDYEKDVMEAKDIIVGYKMTEMSCGPDGVTFGDDDTPSTGLRPGETWEDHHRTRMAEYGQLNTSSAYPLRPASTDGTVVTPPQEASSVITPPPARTIGGQVIRVSTTDSEGRPTQTLSGVVVTQTDESGTTTTEEVSTDSDGGAWIPIGVTTTLVTVSHDGDEVYRAEPGEPIAVTDSPPVIEEVTPHTGDAPPGIIQAGTLADITGRDFGSATEVEVNDEPVNIAASGGDTVVVEFDTVGPADITVGCGDGLTSNPVTIEGVSIVVDSAPPPTMMKGQNSSVTLRILGTERPLPIHFVADNTVVTLGGAPSMTAVSSGGPDNLVRVPVTAIETGSYVINFTLVADAEEG
jgi:hypothetical protein